MSQQVAYPEGFDKWNPANRPPPAAPAAFVPWPAPDVVAPGSMESWQAKAASVGTMEPWPTVPLATVPRPPSLEGRQQSGSAEAKQSVLSSVYFRIWCPEGSAFFSEMSGISSDLDHTEYVETGLLGPMYSRHAGRPKAPTVSFKRAMKTGLDSTWIWSWHQLARKALPGMRRDAVLMLYGPGDDPGAPARVNYTLVSAFPTKLDLTTVKLGGTEVVQQGMTLQCDEIIDINAY